MSEQLILGGLTQVELNKGAEETFFYAMQRGWASGAVSYPMSNGRRQISVDRNDQWICIDTWGDEGGNTKIYYQGDPVWVMRYIGRYTKEAIPCLKFMLANRYELRDFCGGRGAPCSFWGEEPPIHTLMYSNNWAGNFEQFAGTETIRRIGENRILGYHRYWGGTLV